MEALLRWMLRSSSESKSIGHAPVSSVVWSELGGCREVWGAKNTSTHKINLSMPAVVQLFYQKMCPKYKKLWIRIQNKKATLKFKYINARYSITFMSQIWILCFSVFGAWKIFNLKCSTEWVTICQFQNNKVHKISALRISTRLFRLHWRTKHETLQKNYLTLTIICHVFKGC